MKATIKDLNNARIAEDIRHGIVNESFIYMPGGPNGWVYLWPKDNCWHNAATDEDGHMAAYFSVDKAVDYILKLKQKLQDEERSRNELVKLLITNEIVLCGTEAENTIGN